ncbi:hypothetical protein Emag_004846 [Eimeria magna]
MQHDVRTQAGDSPVSLPHVEWQREAATQEASWRIRRSSRSPKALGIYVALAATAAVAAVFLVLQCTRSLGLGKGGEQLSSRRLAALEGGECWVAGRSVAAAREASHSRGFSGVAVQLQQLTLRNEDAALLTRAERSHVEGARRKVERLVELVGRLEKEVATLNEEVIKKEKKLNAELAAISGGTPLPEGLSAALRGLERDKTRVLRLMVDQQDKEAQLASMYYRFEQAVMTLFIRAKKGGEGQSISAAAAAALAAADAVGLGTAQIKGGELLSSLSPASRALLPGMLEEIQQEAEGLFKKLYLSFAKKDKSALSSQVDEAHLLLKNCDAIARAYGKTPLPMPSAAFNRAVQRLGRKTARVSASLREGETKKLGLPRAFELLAVGAERSSASTALGSASSESSSSDDEGPEPSQAPKPADAKDQMESKVGAMVAASEGSLFVKQQWMLELVHVGDDSGLTAEDHAKLKRAKEHLSSLSKSEQDLKEVVKLLTKHVRLDENALNDLVAELPPGEAVPKRYVQLQGDVDFVKKWLRDAKDDLESVREQMRQASYGQYQQALCVLVSARRRLTSGTPLSPLGAGAVGAATVVLGEESATTLPIPTEIEAKAIKISLLEASQRLRLRSMGLKRGSQPTKSKDLRFAHMIAEEALKLAATSEQLLGDIEEARLIRAAVDELLRVCEVSQVLILTRQLTNVTHVTRILEPAHRGKVHPMQLEAVFVDRLHAVFEARKCNISSSSLSERERGLFQQALRMNSDYLQTMQVMLVPIWTERCENLVSGVLKASQDLRDAGARFALGSSPPPPSQGSTLRRTKKKGKQQQQPQRQQKQPRRQLPLLLSQAEAVVDAIEKLHGKLSAVEAELKILNDMELMMPLPAEVDAAIKNVEHVQGLEKMHAETTSALVSQVLSSELSNLLRSTKRPSVATGRRSSLQESQLLKERGPARVPSLIEGSENFISLRAAARRAEDIVVRLVKAGVEERSCQNLRAILELILEDGSD